MTLLFIVGAGAGSALAQGKVSLGLDFPLTMPDLPYCLAADAALAGQPIPTSGPLPSGVVLQIGLYGGTSSTALALISSESINPLGGTGGPPGTIPYLHVVCPFPGGVFQFFQVKIWDHAYTNYEAQLAAGQGCNDYAAANNIFQMIPGTSINYPSIYNGGSTTWAAVGNEAGFLWNFGLSCAYYVYISGQPADQTVVRGGTATFTVVAQSECNCVPLSYQWLFNGIPISGAYSSSCQITNVQPSNAGHYAVHVTGYYNSVQSSDATLTVLPVPPGITSQPQHQTAELADTVSFGVGATGDPPLTYKWFFNATNALGGATTNPVVQLANVQFSQVGSYNVVVTNVTAAVTSLPAMLDVIPAVPRRMVPALTLMGQSGDWLNLEYAPALLPFSNWGYLDTVALTNAAQWYFDASMPLPPERLYRTWTTNVLSPPSALGLHMVPAITLTGVIGNSVRLDYINRYDPVDAWVTNLATITLTNTSQLYFDTSAIGQPARLYRIVALP